MTQKYLHLCCREQWMGGRFRNTHLEGDTICLNEGVLVGQVFLPPVDSGEIGFRWTRVRLEASIPPHCSLKTYARSSDDPRWPELETLLEAKDDGSAAAFRPDKLFGEQRSEGQDLWLPESDSGRYLWLALELIGSGTLKPEVSSVALLMEGDHMIEYLPSIYQMDDFTYRFLSVFTAMAQDLDTAMDDFPRQLAPESADPDMLNYCAAWLCMDPDSDTEKLREAFSRFPEDYETMYTVKGLQRSVERLTGVTPLIIEHFQVDPNAPDCRNPGLYRRLYGENPYRFFLLLKQGVFSQQKDMEEFLGRMRELIPAETEMELILLKDCVQLDWHTYLGVNSAIGDYIPAVIDESATIHYDTTIGGGRA